MHKQFHLHCEAVHTAFVTVVFHGSETDDALLDVLLAAPRLVSLGYGDNVRELLAGHVIDAVYNLVKLTGLELRGAGGIFNIVVVDLLSSG
jgi:hypothetical protein